MEFHSPWQCSWDTVHEGVKGSFEEVHPLEVADRSRPGEGMPQTSPCTAGLSMKRAGSITDLIRMDDEHGHVWFLVSDERSIATRCAACADQPAAPHCCGSFPHSNRLAIAVGMRVLVCMHSRG